MNQLEVFEGLLKLGEMMNQAIKDPKAIAKAGEEVRAQLALTEVEVARRNEANETIHKSNAALKQIAEERAAFADEKQAVSKGKKDNEDTLADIAERKSQLYNYASELKAKEARLYDVEKREKAVQEREAAADKKEAANAERSKEIAEDERKIKIAREALKGDIAARAAEIKNIQESVA